MNIDYISIGTLSLEKSIKFYQDVLGFTLYDRFEPAQDVELAFLSDMHGTKIELIGKVDTGENICCNISIGFEVDDINSTKEHLEHNGVKIISGPLKLPHNVYLLHAEDPNGIKLGFIQHIKIKEPT